MNARYAAVLALTCASIGLAVRVVSQNVQQQKPSGNTANLAAETDAADSDLATSNLKILPKNISHQDLKKMMNQFADGLGVPCSYCHARNSQSNKLDYASDDNPIKQTARFMITMTADINTKYLGQLGDRRFSPPITCGNCHQGQAEPPEFAPKE